jgi:hypothetical protein
MFQGAVKIREDQTYAFRENAAPMMVKQMKPASDTLGSGALEIQRRALRPRFQ